MLLSTDSDSTFLAIENDYQLVGITVQVGVKRCIYMRKISVNILIIERACRSVLKLQLGQEIGVKNYHQVGTKMLSSNIIVGDKISMHVGCTETTTPSEQ